MPPCPYRPPIQWLLGALSLGIKRQGHEAAEIKTAWSSTLTSLIRLHGVVLS